MDSDRTTRELALYQRLLDLSPTEPFEQVLQVVLQLALEATDARQAYFSARGADGEEALWSASAVDTAELDEIRDMVSQGVLEEALRSKEAVNSPLAFRDPRFSSRQSVRGQRIRAVLCVPVFVRSGSAALLLQGRRVPRPFDEEDTALVHRILRALRAPLEEALAEVRGTEDPTERWRRGLRADGVAGSSSALAAALRAVAMVAPLSRIDVMLEGPTGTGKSLLAQVIHNSSPRREGPLVHVPCGTLSEELIESHLFGSVEGGFTGAKSRMGYVASAAGGTLVLDDVDAIPVSRQAVLLRLLQTRRYRPVGADREVEADVRVVATTNASLEERIADGRFREDLLQRLGVVRIQLPGLDERREDIPGISELVLERRAVENGLEAPRLGVEAAQVLQQRRWRGGVRELERVLVSALLQAQLDGDGVIEARHLTALTEEPGEPVLPSYHAAWERWARALLEDRLARAEGSRTQAARELGLSRSRLYELIKQLGL